MIYSVWMLRVYITMTWPWLRCSLIKLGKFTFLFFFCQWSWICVIESSNPNALLFYSLSCFCLFQGLLTPRALLCQLHFGSNLIIHGFTQIGFDCVHIPSSHFVSMYVHCTWQNHHLLLGLCINAVSWKCMLLDSWQTTLLLMLLPGAVCPRLQHLLPSFKSIMQYTVCCSFS